MDLASPISTVVPSLDGPVLLVLAATEEGLSGRQIHKLAGSGSVAGVRLVLQRLATTGLVHAEDVGNSLLYRLNRSHLLAPIVEQLANLRSTLLGRLAEEISSWGIAAVHASVYGAIARGDGDLDSDVDLLLIRPDDCTLEDPRWTAQVDRLMQSVVDLTGNAAHVFELSQSELAGHLGTEAILNDWAEPSIRLVGVPLDHLAVPQPVG
ncbi:hypothetical protein GCM10009630_01970 [Kribbella jejuensis]|uniref:Nucleotidyltransferase-like protein n=1 Tax=Kribbella jejuensis TaxID=236068 RepID=A0A542EUP5_9ACTN|nr:hypothetical protein [Kribbella jejuensis]TQJ19092.1 hypothetical protein FB475_3250 [Kribbella jejuensis]